MLGGTREARVLAETLSGERGFDIVSSLAGRVRDPVLPVGDTRIGGFGGAGGLRDWLREHGTDAVVDATHPFAATITDTAVAVCAELGLPIVVLQREPWTPSPGDRWEFVPDLPTAAALLRSERVFLTIGRQGVPAFCGSDSWFLIRAIDPPTDALPARHTLLLERGPFDLEHERRLLAEHRIEVLVTKNSGGSPDKLVAARELGVQVIMVNRPPMPPHVPVVSSVEAAMRWLNAVPS